MDDLLNFAREARAKADKAGRPILVSFRGTSQLVYPGIPPEVRDKIYNLYFTTKKGGTGIGLAMTYRIVQLHDGTIDVTSEPGKGTTFVLRFPAAVLKT